MARKRMLDPSIWTDEGLAELTPRQQLLYIGLISNADDAGRLKGSAASLRLHLPGVYASVPVPEIETDLAAVLREMGQLVAYEHGGRRYLAFLNYPAWQKIDRPSPSALPAPGADPSAPGDYSTNARRTLDEASMTARDSRARAEVSLREEKLREENAAAAAARGRAREAAAAAAAAAAASVPESVKSLHASLTGAPGYEPSPAFLEKVAAKYGHLDLEEEAIKMLGWLRSQPKAKRRCSTAFVLNWLDRTAQTAAHAQPRASPNGRARTGLRGPGGRQELTTAQLIVDSRQHDIACVANEELPPELRAEVEHLEAIGWRLSAGP